MITPQRAEALAKERKCSFAPFSAINHYRVEWPWGTELFVREEQLNNMDEQEFVATYLPAKE